MDHRLLEIKYECDHIDVSKNDSEENMYIIYESCVYYNHLVLVMLIIINRRNALYNELMTKTGTP